MPGEPFRLPGDGLERIVALGDLDAAIADDCRHMLAEMVDKEGWDAPTVIEALRNWWSGIAVAAVDAGVAEWICER
jgi:hypothetical protein